MFRAYGGDLNIGGKTSGSIQNKISCDSVDFKLDYNAYIAGIKELVMDVLKNKNLYLMNMSISGGVHIYSYNLCTKEIMKYLAEHPEQSQKFAACVMEGTADSTTVNVGAQKGEWLPVGVPAPLPWINASIDTTTVPGTPAKVEGCIFRELGDEMGKSFRECLSRNYTSTLSYIRSLLSWSLKDELYKKQEFTKQCILDQERKETDINSNLGELSFLPDGTRLSNNLGKALIEKAAFALYAPDKTEIAIINAYIDEHFRKLVFSDKSMKKTDASKLLNWYEKFAGGSWKSAEYLCLGTFEKVDKNYNIYKVKLSVCDKYIEGLYTLMVIKALKAPQMPVSTKVGRKVVTHVYQSMRLTIKQEIARYKDVQVKIKEADYQANIKRKKAIGSINRATREIEQGN